MSAPLLSIENLNIRFGQQQAVKGLNLSIQPGERLALVGESGSGKTVSALSILRLLDKAHVEGSITFAGQNLVKVDESALRNIRGREIAMIFQEPMTALNPLHTIGKQIIETLLLHSALNKDEARAKAIALLERTGLKHASTRIDAYPHELSGGQRQRAMIAMALACSPKLLIADEPTTALDWTIRARIVKLLLDLQAEFGMAVLLITHDLNLVRRFAERVAVMEHGVLVEQAPTETLFNSPQHPYTQRLLDSLPVREVLPIADNSPTLLQAKQLRIEYPKALPGWRGWFNKASFAAVEGADLELRAGETVGVVGESGSGKFTLIQALLKLFPAHSGEIIFNGAALALNSRSAELNFRKQVQVVFQDPYGALSPRQKVGQIIGEGLKLHYPELTTHEHHARIAKVLDDVGLPLSALTRYPHEFSGGQRQRIAIARAVVLNPKVLILDEPTSALDVSIQKQVLKLLLALQAKYGLSYLLISHDLTVINALSHRVYVLRDGRIVEAGDTLQVIHQPSHPYTQRLVQATL